MFAAGGRESPLATGLHRHCGIECPSQMEHLGFRFRLGGRHVVDSADAGDFAVFRAMPVSNAYGLSVESAADIPLTYPFRDRLDRCRPNTCSR
jgi:hypothetical protein